MLKHGCPVFDKIAVDIKDINWISNKILLSFDWLYINKGNNNLSTYWIGEGSTGLDFPSKPVSNYNLVDLYISFYNTKGIMKMGLSNKVFPNTIAFGNKEDYNRDIMLYLEVQLIKGFSFNI